MTAKHANGVNHCIVGPSYLQVTYPLIAHSNVFQIDPADYKTESVSPTGLKYSYALTIIDHFIRFAVFVALQDKKEQTIAKPHVERAFGIFGPIETIHSD